MPIDVDQPAFDQESLDSVDIVEWLYTIEETYDLVIDEELVAKLETATFREIHHMLLTALASP